MTGAPPRADMLRFPPVSGLPIRQPIPARVPTLADDVLPILAARCGGGGLPPQAAEDGGGCLVDTAKALSLCDQDARAALVQAPATGVAGMQRVVPGDASRSYLIRKLVPVPAAARSRTTPGHRIRRTRRSARPSCA